MFRDTSVKFQLFSLTLSYIYALSLTVNIHWSRQDNECSSKSVGVGSGKYFMCLCTTPWHSPGENDDNGVVFQVVTMCLLSHCCGCSLCSQAQWDCLKLLTTVCTLLWQSWAGYDSGYCNWYRR